MKLNIKNKIWLALMWCLISVYQVDAVELDSLNRDPNYVTTILKRTEKIVNSLNITDAEVCSEVTNIIANRYFELNDIYETRDKKLAEAKEKFTGDAKLQAIMNAQSDADRYLYRSHFAFPAALSLWLNDSQIEGVKNGLTYNVLNVTYTAHLDMIPTLTEEEKSQIYAWLVEAREFAIDAESSRKKHEVFGKYKGRINNYLAKRGYNLTKEREEWNKRIQSKKESL